MARFTAPVGPRRGRFFLFKVFTLALIVGVGWLLVNVGMVREWMNVNAQRTQELDEIQKLRERVASLQAKRKSLALEGFEAERQARERLGLHKPGEKVIHIKPDAQSDRLASDAIVVPAGTRRQALDDASNQETTTSQPIFAAEAERAPTPPPSAADANRPRNRRERSTNTRATQTNATREPARTTRPQRVDSVYDQQ